MESSWLTAEDFETLSSNLNSKTIKHYDNHWDALKRESLSRNLNPTVKTKSPILFDFGTHLGFCYRRFDGAAWHTETANIDTEQNSPSLTETQSRLRDNINTIMALTRQTFKIRWLTPYNNKTKTALNRYQIIQIDGDWACYIDNAVYAASRHTAKNNKNYTEIGFSTNEPPLFSLTQTEELLNRLIK
jgi:hypothetical protein